MYVKEIWRYPVKSLKGERLERTRIGQLGVEGDRRIVVVSQKTGRVLTARKYPRLLSLQGGLDAHGAATIDGHAWDSIEARRLVHEAVGESIELVEVSGRESFDIMELLVATDGAIDAMGFDGRRLRPNIVIGGVDGMAERSWPGKIIVVGDLRMAPERLRPRCVMTTWDPDTQEQDPSVLRRIVDELDGVMALDTRVLAGGEIKLGDAVTLEVKPD